MSSPRITCYRLGLVFGALAVLGCDEGDPGGGPRPAEAVSRNGLGPSQPESDAPPIQPTREPDDPAVPVRLPQSQDVAGWIKTQPARVASGRDLRSVVADRERAERWMPYRIAVLVRGQYMRHVGAALQIAQIQLVETRSPEDAFGMFSVECGPRGATRGEDVIQIDQAEGVDLATWKGRFFLRMASTWPAAAGDRAAALEGCHALLNRLRFVLPEESSPAVLDVFTATSGIEPALWLARSLTSLQGILPLGRTVPDPADVDGRLGLNADTTLVVAAYKNAAAESPHVTWLVRYPSSGDTRNAYQSYRKNLQQATDPLDANSMLAAPKGHFLLGTWTAEEESIARLLPRLRAALPG